MQIVLKIYDNFFSSIPDMIVDQVIEIEINEDVNSISNMSLKLLNDFTGLKRMQKIEAYEVENNIDTLVFQWFIDSITPGIDNLNLVCKNEKAVFMEQLVLSDKNYVWQTIDFIINDLLSDWNTAFSESWTYSNTLTGTHDKDFKEWDKLFDAIEEIVWLAGWVWIILNEKVITTDLIWTDNSIWTWFTEIVLNKSEPAENNILDFNRKNFSTKKNIIIWSDWTIKVTLSNIWVWEKPLAEYKQFREWDLTAQTQAYLDSKSVDQFIYDLEIEPFTINPNIWDKLYLRIENVSDYLNYNWPVIVNTLKITYANWTRIINIGVSSWYVYIDNFSNKINSLNDKINLLNIK